MLQPREGRITGSRIGVIAKGGYKAWNTLSRELHEAKPIPYDRAVNTPIPSLAHGAKYEPQCVGQFWERHSEYVTLPSEMLRWHDAKALVFHHYTGVSPDAILGQNGRMVSALEVKCPYVEEKFVGWLERGELPEEHKPQVMWSMIVPDLENCWFASWDPRQPEGKNYFDVLVERDRTYEAELMDKVNRFLEVHLAGGEFKPVRKSAKELRNLL